MKAQLLSTCIIADDWSNLATFDHENVMLRCTIYVALHKELWEEGVSPGHSDGIL